MSNEINNNITFKDLILNYLVEKIIKEGYANE